MLLEESFEKASLRQVKQKTNLDGKFTSLNSVMHERVEGDDMIKHSFILFFTKVTAKDEKFRETEYGKLKWFKIDELDKEKVILSDMWLIKNKLNSKIGVKNAYMQEKDGELVSFEVLKK
jgi:ADP-ribose pyrophosphatase YjhB (NUDIX family)